MTRTDVMNALKANGKLGNMGDWQGRHNAAIDAPKAGSERALINMLAGWYEYARTHAERFESPVGDDGVLGDGMEEIARGILTLLNGEAGRLDCGTFDAFIRNTAVTENIEGLE